MTKQKTLMIHPDDDMVVALADLGSGDEIAVGDSRIPLVDSVPAKHKFAARDLQVGETVQMYGITVGRTTSPVQRGGLLTTENLQHAVGKIDRDTRRQPWTPPNVEKWKDQTFNGYVRDDGRVGTANVWIFVPLVFCENRNMDVLRDALCEELGYGRPSNYRTYTRQIAQSYQRGDDIRTFSEVLTDIQTPGTGSADRQTQRVFPNIDGIKFLHHHGGCGGLYQDALTLAGLLAGYIDHPNVAGATVLSLGCQKTQVQDLHNAIHQRNPDFKKPLLVFEQQQMQSEEALIAEAIRQTMAGLADANQLARSPAPLTRLTLGVECGGSDGFSGISANPAMGRCADKLVALGGSVILSEFPELAGCESEIVSRCVSPDVADRFVNLMQKYESIVQSQGGGFDKNPSPGNVRDGLITDAIKSAGAARKGGTSPVVDVLDYTEPVTKAGLNLLCTPGGDVESTTAKTGSGANVHLFSTGLGTPTGNPVAPVLKISTNSSLANRMSDIIDLDAGGIIDGSESIESISDALLQMVIDSASGEYQTKSQRLGQDDFIPWRRGLSF